MKKIIFTLCATFIALSTMAQGRLQKRLQGNPKIDSLVSKRLRNASPGAEKRDVDAFKALRTSFFYCVLFQRRFFQKASHTGAAPVRLLFGTRKPPAEHSAPGGRFYPG